MKRLLSVVVLFPFLLSCSSTPSASDKANALYSEKHLNIASWAGKNECCVAKGKKAALAAGGPASSLAGDQILAAGGNIMDAAVASALALAVERPYGVSLSGGGFLLVHWTGNKGVTDSFYDFIPTAPHKAKKDMYLDAQGNPQPDKSVRGPLAASIPTLVTALAEAHKKYGKLPWEKVCEPAIKLAEEGFPIYPNLADNIEKNKAVLLADPEAKKIFFVNDVGLKAGEKLVQKDLAASLRIIAKEGANSFRIGTLAKKIAAFMKEKGGLIDAQDLRNYKVKSRSPLKGNVKGLSYVTAPLPSAGGVIMTETFNILSHFDIAKTANENPVQYLHLVAESLQRGFADRADNIVDPDFVKSNYQKLLTTQYGDQAAKNISLEKHRPSTEVSPNEAAKASNTSHVSAIDDEGRAVSLTVSVNYYFGAGFIPPGTGILMSNWMDDFTQKAGVKNSFGLVSSAVNLPAPGKRSVSSMSPTIFFEEGKPILVLGSAGGGKIITSTLLTALNYFYLYPKDLKKAVFAPRIHYQWFPDVLSYEAGFADFIPTDLEKRGYKVEKATSASGQLQAVARDPQTGELTAVSEPRDASGAIAK